MLWWSGGGTVARTGLSKGGKVWQEGEAGGGGHWWFGWCGYEVRETLHMRGKQWWWSG